MPAAKEPGPFVEAGLDVAEHFLHMRPRDQRTHFGLSLRAVANDNFLTGLGQPGEEFFGYLALEDQA